jgi:excisionase family DNA binding protein
MRALVTGTEYGAHRSHESRDESHGTRSMPMLLTVDDAAELLRTTKRAIYAMIERRQLPGIIRIGRRVLLRADDLLNWLNQKSAPSQRSQQR